MWPIIMRGPNDHDLAVDEEVDARVGQCVKKTALEQTRPRDEALQAR